MSVDKMNLDDRRECLDKMSIDNAPADKMTKWYIWRRKDYLYNDYRQEINIQYYFGWDVCK